MSERELFQRCFNHLDLEYVDGCGYCESETQSAWEAWQESANRQGYKLVPTTPTMKVYDRLFAEHDLDEDRVTYIYKDIMDAVGN